MADRPEIEKRYRCRHNDKEMFGQCWANHTAFMTESGLKQLHHPYDTNCCEEGFMWLVASMTPKTKHLCRSINYHARCSLAVGIKSVGYNQYHKRLLQELKLDMGNYLSSSLLQKDASVTRK